jgi:hypothetical protein
MAFGPPRPWASRRSLTERWNDNFVATILDAPFEELSFVVSRTMGTASGRIADLTRRELLCPKNFALLRYFGGNGLGLGNSRQHRGGSGYRRSNDSASNSLIITHSQTPLMLSPRSSGACPMIQLIRAAREVAGA